MTWTGSCMCSNIKYKVDLPDDIEPPKLTLCHCTTCKHYTGSAFSANFCVPKDKHSFTQGTPKVYYGDTDHGRKIKRQFCGDCGSPLTSEPGHLVGKILVKAGTLDADHKLRIGGVGHEIYHHRKDRWVHDVGCDHVTRVDGEI